MPFDPGTNPFRLRFSISSEGEDNSAAGNYEIYVSKNAGAYALVTAASTMGVKSTDAGSSADETAITVQRLSSPEEIAAIDLDFSTGAISPSGAFTDYLSCVRADGSGITGSGFAKTAAGALMSFGQNTLRRTDLGLLIEEPRTNLITDSQDFTQIRTWSFIDHLNAFSTGQSAPDGTTTAQGMVENGDNSGHKFGHTDGTTIISGTIYTISCYVQPGIRNCISFYFADLTYTHGGQIWFDLTGAGAIFSTWTGGSTVIVGYGVEALANSWYRCWVSMHIPATAIVTIIQGATGDTNSSYVGSNGSTAYILWGCQLEAGDFPTSYTPTTTAAVTRAADVIITASTLQTTIAAAAGTIVAQLDNGEMAAAAANIVDSNGTNLLGFNSTDKALASITASLASGNSANRTSADKLGLAWNASGRSLVLNGGTAATDANAQTPSMTQHLGSDGSASFANAYIKRLIVWASKLANTTLQGFTS